MSTCDIDILRLPHAAGLPLPAYHSAHAAGLDLVAAVPAGAPVIIPPGERAAIPTGLAFALPAGIEGQIRPRSGLALHHGVTVLNSPGTLDADYRGEVHVILANFGAEPVTIGRGARIAQLVLAPTLQATIREVANLDETTRGIRGFSASHRERNENEDHHG
jgi:dUTP pyrophosphatase